MNTSVQAARQRFGYWYALTIEHENDGRLFRGLWAHFMTALYEDVVRRLEREGKA